MRRGHPLVAPHRGDRLQHRRPRQARVGQVALRRAVPPLAQQRQQQVLGADVLVVERLRLALGGHQCLVAAHARRKLPTAPAHLRLLFQQRAAPADQRVDVEAHPLQHPRHQPVGLLGQRQQQVQRAQLGVLHAHRQRVRALQRGLGLLGELLNFHALPFPASGAKRPG